jgi:RNase P/RNase MRP subunit POP5
MNETFSCLFLLFFGPMTHAAKSKRQEKAHFSWEDRSIIDVAHLRVSLVWIALILASRTVVSLNVFFILEGNHFRKIYPALP